MRLDSYLVDSSHISKSYFNEIRIAAVRNSESQSTRPNNELSKAIDGAPRRRRHAARAGAAPARPPEQANHAVDETRRAARPQEQTVPEGDAPHQRAPKWRAENVHLLQQLEPGASSKKSAGDRAALAALGIEKLGGDRKRNLSEKPSRKTAEREAMVEAARKNPRMCSSRKLKASGLAFQIANHLHNDTAATASPTDLSFMGLAQNQRLNSDGEGESTRTSAFCAQLTVIMARREEISHHPMQFCPSQIQANGAKRHTRSMAEFLPDADVLRVLELHISGLNRKAIVRQTQFDDFDVMRIVSGKKSLRTQRVIAKYPEWSAKFRHLLLGLKDEAATGNGGSLQQSSNAPMSEYEAKRLQRMGENQAMLAVLGMQKLAPKRAFFSGPSSASAEREAARKNPRRSSRLSLLAETNGSNAGANTSVDSEVLALALTRAEQNALFADRKPPVPYQDLDLPIVDLNAPVPAVSDIIKPAPATVPQQQQQRRQPPPSAKKQRMSSQQLEIDLESFHARWLGNQIWPKGKQTIMQGMCPSHIPTFSKMSGIQAWKNAVVLFVNVQGESQYDNVFHQVPPEAPQTQEGVPVKEEGDKSELKAEGNSSVYFQWFAQARQHLASPVILRLLNAQKGDASLRFEDESYYQDQEHPATNVAPREPVLLFIRHVDGPYIYCGRLGFLGFRSNSSPLEFRWQLLDAASLAWSKIRTLIESSNTQVEGAAVVEDHM